MVVVVVECGVCCMVVECGGGGAWCMLPGGGVVETILDGDRTGQIGYIMNKFQQLLMFF